MEASSSPSNAEIAARADGGPQRIGTIAPDQVQTHLGKTPWLVRDHPVDVPQAAREKPAETMGVVDPVGPVPRAPAAATAPVCPAGEEAAPVRDTAVVSQQTAAGVTLAVPQTPSAAVQMSATPAASAPGRAAYPAVRENNVVPTGVEAPVVPVEAARPAKM